MLDSALAFALSDSDEKWNILALSFGASNLEMNSSWCGKERLMIGFTPSGNHRLWIGGRVIEILFPRARKISDQVLKKSQ